MKPELDLFAILPEDKIPEKGKILISEPFLPDTFFNRSIVYLTDHNSKGSVGFILNKKLDIKISDAVEGFKGWNENLNMGGPVAPDTLHYLHNLGHLIPKSVWVDGDIYWGGDIDKIRELIKSGTVTQNQIRFFLGYSGWQANQLEDELGENAWVVAEMDPMEIMSPMNKHFWKNTLKKMGKKFEMWSNFPENPQMN